MKDDSGVFDRTTGKWMMRVAATPQAGQYMFDKEHGYTFAAADEGHARSFVGDPVPTTFTDAELAEMRDQLCDYERYPRVLPLLDELIRSRALLKRIEYCAEDGCPTCGRLNPEIRTEWSGPPSDYGHKPDCELAALLG